MKCQIAVTERKIFKAFHHSLKSTETMRTSETSTDAHTTATIQYLEISRQLDIAEIGPRLWKMSTTSLVMAGQVRSYPIEILQTKVFFPHHQNLKLFPDFNVRVCTVVLRRAKTSSSAEIRDGPKGLLAESEIRLPKNTLNA